MPVFAKRLKEQPGCLQPVLLLGEPQAGIGLAGWQCGRYAGLLKQLSPSIAILRVRTQPSPGKAVNESAGERVISGTSACANVIGTAGGTAMPSPRATAAASSGATLTREARIRVRALLTYVRRGL